MLIPPDQAADEVAQFSGWQIERIPACAAFICLNDDGAFMCPARDVGDFDLPDFIWRLRHAGL